MKKLFKLSMAVLILSVVFVLSMSTGSQVFAATITGSVAVFSAISHFTPAFSGMAFSAPIIPDFTEKSFEDLEGMTAKEVFEYRSAELAHKVAVNVAAAEARIVEEKAVDAPDADRIAKMEETIKTLKTEAIETGLRFKKIGESTKDLGEANSALKDLNINMDKIKSISKGSEEEVEIKGLVNKADLVRSAITGNTQAQDVAGIGQLGHININLYDLFQKIPMGTNNNGTLRYWDWDSATTVRAAEMVAEGATFPESTAKWQEYTITVKKVGDTLPVSAEFFEDEAMFAAELTSFLLTNVALIVNYQLCYGAGTGQNLTGLFTNATAFAPATVTHVSDPTIYDLIEVMDEQITKPNGGKFNPNFVLMNKSTINKMRLSKDANENYILPPFVGRDGANVGGKLVIETNQVNDDELLVGDSMKAKIYEKAGVTLSRGTVDAQFVEDMETLKVRQRLLLLVKNSDQAGFVKVTDIDAALAAIDATS